MKKFKKIEPEVLQKIKDFKDLKSSYDQGVFTYSVRGKEFSVNTKTKSLSGNNIPRAARQSSTQLQKYTAFRESVIYQDFFPYGAGIFPFKRSDEEPKRMFAGEEGHIGQIKRFHYLSKDDPAKRLSTAFDSVTLYGEDPDERRYFGKIGEAGVSIATLDDMRPCMMGLI